MSLCVTDWSGAQWVSVFNDVAEKIVQAPAREIHELKMQGAEDQVERIYKNALFKTYIMRVSHFYCLNIQIIIRIK